MNNNSSQSECFHSRCLNQSAIMILLYELVELATPNQLDHIKASTSKCSFILLEHLGISSHWSIQALVVAIHDEDHVVQPLSPSHRNGRDGLRLIHLTISHKGPNSTLRGVGQAPQVQVAKESSLVDSTSQNTSKHDKVGNEESIHWAS